MRKYTQFTEMAKRYTRMMELDIIVAPRQIFKFSIITTSTINTSSSSSSFETVMCSPFSLRYLRTCMLMCETVMSKKNNSNSKSNSKINNNHRNQHSNSLGHKLIFYNRFHLFFQCFVKIVFLLLLFIRS